MKTDKQKLMAAFEKSLVELSSMEEPSREDWSYPDGEI